MTTAERREAEHLLDPNHPSKPESPTDLTRPSWLYALRMTGREIARDQCTDLAAALTYYALLSIFPALVVMVSLLGVFGDRSSRLPAVIGNPRPGQPSRRS